MCAKRRTTVSQRYEASLRRTDEQCNEPLRRLSEGIGAFDAPYRPMNRGICDRGPAAVEQARRKHERRCSFSLAAQVRCKSNQRAAAVLAATAIVLDFETTGLQCDEGHRVTEVAALRIRGNRIVGKFESLVNCDMRIPRHIAGFTGITQSMVDAAPRAPAVFRELVAFIGDDQVIAHNAWFDQSFLAAECDRLGILHNTSEFICSYRIARRLLPRMKSHALGCLASHLRIPFTPGAHRAAVDASVTASVIFRLCELAPNESAYAQVDLNVLRRLSRPIEQETEVATAA